MGLNQITNKKKKKYDLTVNEQLTKVINDEIKPTKNQERKATKKLFPKSRTFLKNIPDLYDDDDEEDDEMDNEIGLNDISDLVDLIYTKNINTQLKHRVNKSLYETVFDIRNMMDFNEDLNNNEYNIKACKVMKDIVDPEISVKQNNISENENEINNDKDQSIDNYYIENDFFRKWDYKDDIFEKEEGFVQNFEEEEEKEIDEKRNNEEENGNEDKMKKINFNKDNNTINHNADIENNKNNSESYSDDINKDKDKEIYYNQEVNQSEITNKKSKLGKYDQDDSYESEEIERGNKTRKIIDDVSNSEDDDNSPKVYNINEKEDTDENEEYENISKINTIQSEYRRKIVETKNNNRSNILYKKKSISRSNKSGIYVKNNKDQINRNNNKKSKEYSNNDNKENKINDEYNDENNNIYNNINNYNEYNNNNKDYNIDKYYPNDVEHKAKTPNISRIRNRRVDYRQVMINKRAKDDESEKKQIYLGNIGNPRKKIYNKTPDSGIRPKKYILNNISNIKPTTKQQEIKKYKLDIDIAHLNNTIRKVEGQIKTIENYQKTSIIRKNKDNDNFNNNNNKRINNIKVINNNKNNNKIIPLSYNRIKKRNLNIRENKTFDDNIIKKYKDIMPEINRAKRENQIENENGPQYIFRTKTPDIKLKKKKKATKKKNNINIKKNKDKSNFFTEGKNYKIQSGNMRNGFHEKKPAWK